MIQEILQQLEKRVHKLEHLGSLQNPNEPPNWNAITALETQETEIDEQIAQINIKIEQILNANENYRKKRLEYDNFKRYYKTHRKTEDDGDRLLKLSNELREIEDHLIGPLERAKIPLMERLMILRYEIQLLQEA